MATKTRPLNKVRSRRKPVRFRRASLLNFAAALLAICATAVVCRTAIFAIAAMLAINPAAWLEESGVTSAGLRSNVQKHFLSYGIYIPLSDIVAIPTDNDSNARLVFIMRKSCGDGMIYAWVPIQFRIPFFGVRTFEWCWTFPRQRVASEPRNSQLQKELL